MKYLWFSLIMVLLLASGMVKMYSVGYEQACEDIISEKCWLDKQTRDINCVRYIAK